MISRVKFKKKSQSALKIYRTPALISIVIFNKDQTLGHCKSTCLSYVDNAISCSKGYKVCALNPMPKNNKKNSGSQILQILLLLFLYLK